MSAVPRFCATFSGLEKSRGGGQREFAGSEVAHGNEVLHRAEAPGFALHGGEHAVQPLQKSIGGAGLPEGAGLLLSG